MLAEYVRSRVRDRCRNLHGGRGCKRGDEVLCGVRAADSVYDPGRRRRGPAGWTLRNDLGELHPLAGRASAGDGECWLRSCDVELAERGELPVLHGGRLQAEPADGEWTCADLEAGVAVWVLRAELGTRRYVGRGFHGQHAVRPAGGLWARDLRCSQPGLSGWIDYVAEVYSVQSVCDWAERQSVQRNNGQR